MLKFLTKYPTPTQIAQCLTRLFELDIADTDKKVKRFEIIDRFRMKFINTIHIYEISLPILLYVFDVNMNFSPFFRCWHSMWNGLLKYSPQRTSFLELNSSFSKKYINIFWLVEIWVLQQSERLPVSESFCIIIFSPNGFQQTTTTAVFADSATDSTVE